MGVRITNDESVAIYDSVTETAFGPIFQDEYEAQEFLDWLKEDARRYSEAELVDELNKFRREQEAKGEEE